MIKLKLERKKTNSISASIQKQTVKLNSSPEYELGWSSD